ncbi:MAG: crossover junction endodeoxyribonuclease RuvC [Micavibrio sp.]|nr:crossover junction endodeoxyribonuclease RuvC [Micavibrio sp.]
MGLRLLIVFLFSEVKELLKAADGVNERRSLFRRMLLAHLLGRLGRLLRHGYGGGQSKCPGGKFRRYGQRSGAFLVLSMVDCTGSGRSFPPGRAVHSGCMRVFGIDCGTEFTGYGVVEVDTAARTPRLRYLTAGAVKLSKKDRTPVRLAQVYAELMALMDAWQPEIVAIEEVFFSANAKSALKLGQVRGVALLAAANCGKPVAEYAPLAIKSAVVGYGLAAKEQVQFMVTRLLELAEPPTPFDACDALAIAICHIHNAQTQEALRR